MIFPAFPGFFLGYENVVQMINGPAFKLEVELVLVPWKPALETSLFHDMLKRARYLPCSVEQ